MNNVFLPIPASIDTLLGNRDLKDSLQAGAAPADFDELAHDLRQPLSTIESLAYYLELTVKDEQIRSRARQIRDMVVKAHEILEHAHA